METIFKKTTDLTESELSQIVDLFNKVFERDRTVEVFLNQTLNNPLGYSYHSLLIEDGKIVGLNSYVPSCYKVNSKKMLFANSIDSMVQKEYRDFFNFKSMVDLAYKEMAHDGVCFVYGYPNDNSYPVLTKSKLMKDIGKMRTYCLPIRVGGLKKGFGFLNPLSMLFCRVWVGVCGIFASSKKIEFPIHKEDLSYNATRYRRGDGNYLSALIGSGIMYYKITEHEGIRTAFLIDLTDKSSKNFVKAIKHIILNHRREFDVLLYPGWLPCRTTGMICLPRKAEPKNFNFTGKILNKTEIPAGIWDIENWDTNLSNYDLI